ncbi:MAG: hypothetical protein WCF29_03125, partial [Pseudolabrys sp.]
MTSLEQQIDQTASANPNEVGGVAMVLWQTLLGIAILFVWQGVSGRLIDNFFISNSVSLDGRSTDRSSPTCGRRSTQRWPALRLARFSAARSGIWLGVSPFISRLLNPYLNGLNALPKVALAPLFVLWFG